MDFAPKPSCLELLKRSQIQLGSHRTGFCASSRLYRAMSQQYRFAPRLG